MKRVVSLLCAAVIVLSLASLTACSKGKKQDLDGTYRMVEIVVKGKDMSEELETEEVILTVEGDQALYDYLNISHTWTVDRKKQTMATEDGTKVPYRFDGTTLTIEQDGGVNKMVFEKQE